MVTAEKSVQGLVEEHLELMLGVRFLASEYGAGPVHGGRADTLGLDENGSPVVVEFKRGTDAGVLTRACTTCPGWSITGPSSSISSRPGWERRKLLGCGERHLC